VGILSKDGVVLAAEKKILSKARLLSHPLRGACLRCSLPLRLGMLRPQPAGVRVRPMRPQRLAAWPAHGCARRAWRQP
jgi:hypothetical protein